MQGMFDPPAKLTDEYPEGTPFTIWGAEYLGKHRSPDYGDNDTAEVVVSPADDPENKRTFRVFGILADQIRRQGPNDLPATVKIEKQGRANVFVPVETGGVQSPPDF